MPKSALQSTIDAVLAQSKRLRKLEVSGGAGVPGGGISVTDSLPPTVPQDLAQVGATSTSISLSWTASSDNVAVIGYRVYRAGILIATTQNPFYTDSSLTPNTSYTYTVSAVDFANNESPQTPPLTATTSGAPPDTVAPSTPSNLTASNVTPTTVTLVWNASSDNVGVAGYTVYRNGTPIASPNALTFTDVTVLPSTAYTYSVDAFDAAGNHSGQSTAIIVNTPALPTSGIWYVATTGSATNDGSIGQPWTLDKAINGAGGGLVVAGNTIYIRGGTYDIATVQLFTGLAGTSTDHITIRNYPGERVTIRNTGGGTPHSTVELRTLSYVDVYGLEFTMYNYTRSPEVPAGVAIYHTVENAGFTQSNVRFFNCIYHDCQGKAVGSFLTSDGMEWNGCYFYFNGSSASVDWTVHVQSAVGKTKKFKDCVFVHSASDEMRFYSAAGAEALEGLTLEGNTFSGYGSLYANQGVGIMLGGTVATVKNTNVLNNTFHNHLVDDADSRAFQLGDLGTAPTTLLNLIISATGDDGTYNPTPTFSTTSTIQLGISGGPLAWGAFFRFQNVTIPQGAAITAATLTVEAVNAEVSANLNVNIRADKSSVNPTAPTSYADASGRARTTAVCNWTITGGWTTGDKTTPSLASVIQEIVNQGSWVSGNALTLFADENGSTADIWLRDRSGIPANAARLSITYTSTSTLGPTDDISDRRWATDGSFTANPSTLQVGRAGGPVDWSSSLRWSNLAIPQGAVISSAHVQWTAGNSEASLAMRAIIRGEAADNPTSPTSQADALARARTTAQTGWVISTWTSGTAYTSPDIGAIVQEIVNRPGWVSGANSLQLFVEEDTVTHSGADIWPAGWNHATLAAPNITITYQSQGSDGGANTVTIQGNYGKASRIDAAGGGYVSVTMQNNTWIYSGSHIGITETRFPTNTWQHTNFNTGQQVVTRAYDWDSHQGNLIIYNWTGAASVTVNATDLAGLTISSGDNYTIRNAEDYFSDVLQGVYNGSSITIPFTGHTQATPVGGLTKPVSYFPYFAVFHISVQAGTPPPPSGDTTAPTVPTGLTATTINSSSIGLTWTPSTDAVGVTGYTIYRNGSNVGTSVGASFTDTGLTPGTTYTYKVDAYDAAGNHSAQSTGASAATSAVTGKFVGPSGSSSNPGTQSAPWSIAYALAGAGGQISPGDTVWLIGGNYNITGYTYVTANGTSSNPIYYKALPGQRVTMRADSGRYHTWELRDCSWLYFYDIEFTKTGYTRTTATATSSLEAHCVTDTNYLQTGIKFFGCIFHDNNGMGVKSWESTLQGCEFNGCVNYYNGQDPQHDHGYYCHNHDTYEKLWKDCITHNNACFNFHGYDDGTRDINHLSHVRHVFFNPTSLYPSGPSRKPNILIGSNQANTLHPKADRCLLYSPSSSSTFQLKFGYGASTTVSNPVLTSNYSVGRPWYLETAGWTGATVTNNTIYCPGGTPSTTAARINAGSGNTIATVPTSGNHIVVNAYDWDAKRANVVIFNFAGASSVTIANSVLTGAGVAIASGNTYELRNAEDFFGDVLTGTYNGTSITIPMTGRTQATPGGGIGTPPTAFPYFGCFVLKVG